MAAKFNIDCLFVGWLLADCFFYDCNATYRKILLYADSGLNSVLNNFKILLDFVEHLNVNVGN
jgi:hypothetical protein